MRTFLLFILLSPLTLFAQVSENMTLLSNYNPPNMPLHYGVAYTDIWGYHNANGTNVAIIGGMEDILFVNVTEPANPTLITSFHVTNADGTTNLSLWRDFKSYGDYVYAVADEGISGLLIFNLSQVPSTVLYYGQTTTFFNRAHNIFIDEPNARLYVAGSNSVSSGLIILDLNIPAAPVLEANVPLNTLGGGYVHDVYVRDNIAYCSHGSLSKLQMYDFSDLPSITVVGSIDDYPEQGYNHSSWLNGDGNMLVMCDETHGSDVKLVDISDPQNISADDIHTFYSELLGPGAPGASIAHNPFILGDFCYLSYYHDGVQVFDISNPTDIQRLAYYDTDPDNTDYSGYEGCWGVYPFLPSGIIIASDENNGLFVMQVTNFPLDLNFLTFDATRVQEGIKLEWAVADVSNGDLFEVRRSDDGGVTYIAVGSVPYVSGKGQYAFIDKSAFPNQGYHYKIDFIEYDGSRKSSPTRYIRNLRTTHAFVVANPITDALHITSNEPVEDAMIRLYAMNGAEVWQSGKVDMEPKMEFPLQRVATGSYVMTIQWPGGRENMLVQKVD